MNLAPLKRDFEDNCIIRSWHEVCKTSMVRRSTDWNNIHDQWELVIFMI